MITIHQFTPAVAYGDGVTGGIFFTRTLLRELGFHSEIFARHIDERLEDEVYSIDTYPSCADQWLLVHHSIGHKDDSHILSLPDHLILVYHNITPEHFFEDSPHLSAACRWGRDQLFSWPRNRFAGAYADSDYNRDELIRAGYSDSRTIPLLVDLSRFDEPVPPSYTPVAGDPFTILFVGRIVENKAQDQLIDVLDELILQKENNLRLVLVGGVSSASYYDALQSKIVALGLSSNVVLAGKVSDEELRRWYISADLYLSLSEHEGFGMPLLEAMAHDLPVLAYDSGALSTTLPASSLFGYKAPGRVARAIITFMKDPVLRHRIVNSQREHLRRFKRDSLLSELAIFLEEHGIDIPNSPLTYSADLVSEDYFRIDGPCDSTYSLALVNRELGRALLNQGESLSFFATEGPGNYSANRDFLSDDPQVLAALSDYPRYARNIIRNLYPPRVSSMGGVIKILGPYGWEESAFPSEYVQNFNRRLSGIACMSSYVVKILRDNGVSLPLCNTGIGADHILAASPEPLGFELPSGINLLHVSSCFPRKGVDVLIAALEEISMPLTLIVKTFPNPHNTLRRDLLCRGWANTAPDLYVRADKTVRFIEDDLTMAQMRTLYSICDALVAPSRGEGFGLPLAEAMLLNLPVITTAYSGQSDFCNAETAWMVDYSFAPADTHMGLFDSVWAEPDINDLRVQIEAVLRSSSAEKSARTDAARTLIESHYTWGHVAQKMADFIRTSENSPISSSQNKVGVISTYNTRCGIATYTAHLTQYFSNSPVILAARTTGTITLDRENVIRCWDAGKDTLQNLSQTIENLGLSILLIQFNYSLFDLPELGRFIERQIDERRRCFITLHSTVDDIPDDKKLSLLVSALNRCSGILVHSIADLNRLKGHGVIRNVTLFPHGLLDHPLEKPVHPYTSTFTIATYGFFLPHKGLIETIQAIALMRDRGVDVRLNMINARYPAPISDHLVTQARALIEQLSLEPYVTICDDFLSDEESLYRISQNELVLFPYQNTGESASGAVRYGLASRRPVAVTAIPIFDDLGDAVIRLEGFDPESLADALIALIERIRTSDVSIVRTARAAERWRSSHTYPHLSRRLETLLTH